MTGKGSDERETGVERALRPTRVWGGVGIFVAAAGLIIAATTGGSIGQMSIRAASALLVLVAMLVYLLLCRQSILGAWAPLSMAFLILALFHAGLFVEIAASGGLSTSFQFHQEWMVRPVAQHVVLVVVVAFLAFLLGASFPVAFRRQTRGEISGGRQFTTSRAHTSRTDDEERHRVVAARVGALLVISGVLFWFYENISQDGWLFFTLGYRNFFSSSRDLDTSVTVLPILLGVGLIAQCMKLASSRFALALFGVYSIVSLIVGARIYPMSGLVIFLVVVGMRRRMPRSWWLFGGVIAALATVSLIRSFRNDGLVALQGNTLLVDPVGSLSELGSTVKVVGVSYLWHEEDHELYASGLTFANPFIRGFNTLFNVPNIDGAADPGSFVNVIASREGQIGGSIIAEAHHNWAVLGVVLVLFVWALALSATTSVSTSSLSMSVTALLFVLFLIQVRGFFGPIPALSVVGGALIVATRIIPKFMRPLSRVGMEDERDGMVLPSYSRPIRATKARPAQR